MGPVFKICVVFFIIRTSVLCFNLEYRSPIVKRGERDSYFGYSVALHKTENNSDIRSSWLLVGAPLGENLQPNVNRSGALYKCPINNFEEQQDCIQIQTDGRRLASGQYVPADFDYEDVVEKAPFQLRPPANDEIKHNQWLGVNVRSQGPGGKVIVCAHRYIWGEDLNVNQHGWGLCYSLDNELEWENQWEPCKGRSVLHEHQQFSYCQAGTSLALLSDGTALIGSPGPFTWRGTLFVLSIAGDFLSRDKNTYLGPLNDKPEPINKYSYLGMSVAAGKFFYDQNISYAAGAPRSHDHGQVYIFNKHNSELEMNISLIIDGEQIASNFGYELLAADFNKDGFDDLLVAAPFYFSADTGGGVHIYYNLKNCTVNCTADAILRGGLETRFGFALANLGDINRDGYIDLAVGAPYEGNGAIYIYLGSKDGIIEKYSQKIHPEWAAIRTLGYSLSGGLDMDNNGYPDLLAGAYDSDAVLLFRARPIIGIETEIVGKELENIDMTHLGCANDATNNQNKCFSFQACFTIISQETNVENVTIKCEIEEVQKRGISRIWFKKADPRTKHHDQTRYIPLQRNQAYYCTNETVYLRNGTSDFLTPIKFRLNYTIANNEPHSAILNQTSVQDFIATFKKDCGTDGVCQSEMIMSAKLLLNKTEEQQYILNLGDFEEFQIEVNVTNKGDPAYEAKVYFIFPLSVRFIDLVNKTRGFKVVTVNETIIYFELGNPLKANKPLTLQLRFETKDIANQSKANLENELHFLVFVNSTSEELSNQTKTKLTTFVSRKAKLKLFTFSFTKTVVYGGEVKGESVMKTFEDVGSIVKHTYQIQQLGPMPHADLEIAILWPWQVANDKPQGKWLLYLEDVNITDGTDKDHCYVDPPDAINILNLTRLTPESFQPVLNNINYNTSDQNISENSFIRSPDDSYNLTSESLLLDSFSSTFNQDHQQEESYLGSLLRRRRSTGYVVPAETIPEHDGKTRKVVTMDCKTNTAKCVTIYCKFPKFPKNKLATVVVTSRLWNSTFIEDYSQIDWVRILSYGNLSISDLTIEQHQDSQPVTLIETRAFPDLSIQLKTEVPLWIIILAVVAGLVLLILLIFILWRVGFFKRNRIKDPTLSGNLTKQSEQETLLNK